MVYVPGNVTAKSPAGPRFTENNRRSTLLNKHLKIARVGQSGEFYCYIPGGAMECYLLSTDITMQAGLHCTRSIATSTAGHKFIQMIL